MNCKANKAYNKWTDYEDAILQEVVEKYGRVSWNKISRQMSVLYNITKRTGKQCRQRWLTHLNATNNRNQWTTQDDQNLFSQQKKFGTKWNQIAKCFPGRTDSFIKNRFYSKARKSLRKMCKFSKVKTTSINVYEIKPCTLTFLFKKGQSQQTHENTGIEQDIICLEEYREILRIIFLFMQKSSMPSHEEISMQKVEWAILKIMQIHRIRQLSTNNTGQEEAIKGMSYCEKVLEEENSSNFHYGIDKIEDDEINYLKHNTERSIKYECKQERKTTETKYQMDMDWLKYRQYMIKQQDHGIRQNLIYFTGQANIKQELNPEIFPEEILNFNEDKIKTEPTDSEYQINTHRNLQIPGNIGQLGPKIEESEQKMLKIEQEQITYRIISAKQQFPPPYFLLSLCKKEEY